MIYYSTGNKSRKVSFREAVLNGIPLDKGLYFPETIPSLETEFIEELSNLSNEEIAFECISKFTGKDIDEVSLKRIISETINFKFPCKKLSNDISVLELFHGPTMAFKDVGARFTSRVLSHFNISEKRKKTVLVATSGDTGAAVASGFHKVKGINVFILFPKGRISKVQEKQITSLSDNIYPIELDGSFDDCQRMVKEAMTNNDLRSKFNFTTANSINISRWIPQILYYFFAYKQIKDNSKDIAVSIPSGNFGNIFSCLVAISMGLPFKKVIASNNLNDTFTKFIESNYYKPKKSVKTISSAMDVGDPSNFIRIEEYFLNDFNRIKKVIDAYSFSDEETKIAIADLNEKYNYICDPHGAVGYLGVKKHKTLNKDFNYIFLETAHFSKFMDEIMDCIKEPVGYPKKIEQLLSKDGVSHQIKTYLEFKNYINLIDS
ncbi:MAG: threonine synthase [Cytophagia bacterium]|nr:threonine synthase [Cytophagia bacterium]